ncbi:MAG: PEP-CTERM sorting domain-containing protein [Verrucomicrobiaceae bacterium]
MNYRILSLSSLALASAHANHVDFISDGGFSLSATDATNSAIQTGAGGNLLGGEREVVLTADLGSLTASVNAPVGPGPVGTNGAIVLAVSADSPDALGSLNLRYDGAGSAGLGGADFNTNWNFLRVDLASISGGALDLRLTVSDSDGSMAQAAIPALTTGGFYSFSFDDPAFVNGGVDFGSLDSLTFDFETIDPGVSFSINSITREVVPEPGATLLAGVGCLALIGRRRRS